MANNQDVILVAGWSLTKMCNLNCIHCYNASGKRSPDELSLEEALAVVDKLKKAGVSAVNFGGGECALREDFIDICKYLKKLEIKISYTTNGTTFPIIEPYLDLFHDVGVSIDFADEKRHDLFRGKKGTYKAAIEALKKLVSRGVDNELVTCLTKLNCSETELAKIHDLAVELNVDNWRLNRFRAEGRGVGNKDSLGLTKDDLHLAYRFLSNHVGKDVSVPEPLFRAAYGNRYFLEGDPSGFSAFRIQPDGEVTPSVFLNISGGNIVDKTLDEIMSSPIFQAIRNREPKGKCRTCPAYYHCRGGDAGASFLAYGHFNGPDPLCYLNNDDAKIAQKHSPKNWNVHEMYLCTLYVPIKE